MIRAPRYLFDMLPDNIRYLLEDTNILFKSFNIEYYVIPVIDEEKDTTQYLVGKSFLDKYGFMNDISLISGDEGSAYLFLLGVRDSLISNLYLKNDGKCLKEKGVLN